MNRTIRLVFLFFIIIMTFQSDETIFANKEDFRTKIDEYIKTEPHLKGASIGISIRDQETGEIIYDHHGSLRLRPASNLKIFTAISALSILGENHTFLTEIWTDGEIEGMALQGNLYVKGKGDPTLTPKDLKAISNELKKLGITTIKGNIYADDSWYDDVRYSQDIPWLDEQEYYGAQISPLTLSPDEDYDAGTIIVQVKPNKNPGEKGIVSIYPNTDYVKVINSTLTGTKEEKKELHFEREHGTNKIKVEGVIPQGSSEKEWMSVWDPSLYMITVLEEQLKHNGISVTGSLERKKVPSDAKLLHKRSSEPLSKLLIPFLKLSNNTHGEILVKEIGKQVKGNGSWDTGLYIMMEELAKLGIHNESVLFRDGSGISHVNLVTANELTNVLYIAQQQEWFSAFRQSLPVAGMEERMIGGSLRYRMNVPPLKGNVVAKTGTISTVSTLSGYIETVHGKNYIFSILLNNLLDEDVGKHIEDHILHLIGG